MRHAAKALILRGLARAGVVPASQVERAKARMRQVSRKAATLNARLAKIRASADTWRRRHEEAAAAAAEWQAAASRATADLERAHGETATWRRQAKALAWQVDAKLSVIEAAIQILDARTRSEDPKASTTLEDSASTSGPATRRPAGAAARTDV